MSVLNGKKSCVVIGMAGVIAAMTMAAQAPKQKAADPAATADRIVNECAGIRSGELVWITGGVRDAELLENIAVNIRKLGAHPLLSIGSDRLVRKMVDEVPAKFDSQEPAFALKLAEIIDAQITVDYSERPDLMADINASRIIAHQQAFAPVYKTMQERNVVNVNLGNGLYPTTALAKRFGVSTAELERIFWSAVNVDYNVLQNTGALVLNKLAGAKTLNITAANGTNLTVDIAQRTVFVSDGVVSSEDRYQGGPACQVWLPAGEVYVTPVPGTASGKFVADNFFFEGQPVDGLTLMFEKGKLTSMTARGDITRLQEQYDAAPKGKELFAAVDIGINPNLVIPANSKLVSWIASGTITVGFGGNAWAGGENTVPFDVFAHLNNGTLKVDGTTLIDQGKLQVK